MYFAQLKTWLPSLGSAPCSLCQLHHAEATGLLCAGCLADLPWRGESVQVQALSVQVAFDYAWPIDRLIQRYKYHGELLHGELLATGLLRLARPEVDALLAVPLSPSRLRTRGFNQSHELAKRLSQAWQLPLLSGIERRVGLQQQGLSRSERLQNLEDAFHLATPQILPQRIALLDDVLTTGSTLIHLADFLKIQGVEQVCALVVASHKHA